MNFPLLSKFFTGSQGTFHKFVNISQIINKIANWGLVLKIRNTLIEIPIIYKAMPFLETEPRSPT